jgi:hypothetical protein
MQCQQGIDCQQHDVVVPQPDGRGLMLGRAIAILLRLLPGTLDLPSVDGALRKLQIVILNEKAGCASEMF